MDDLSLGMGRFVNSNNYRDGDDGNEDNNDDGSVTRTGQSAFNRAVKINLRTEWSKRTKILTPLAIVFLSAALAVAWDRK